VKFRASTPRVSEHDALPSAPKSPSRPRSKRPSWPKRKKRCTNVAPSSTIRRDGWQTHLSRLILVSRLSIPMAALILTQQSGASTTATVCWLITSTQSAEITHLPSSKFMTWHSRVVLSGLRDWECPLCQSSKKWRCRTSRR